ncbi:hypothetical protein EXIGLDRAFT_763178 [Exidia glandulosa HHB12029]|uniref:Uncharacterized protein n=1 Tax=Exidia glandulosa HHB12029 TaxID=1314781 RepID=A0A165M9E6_EXIGL|nr:hypothetical protein EXIGLDRAFT_763178 [Exidia glandulosa HHB12029]
MVCVLRTRGQWSDDSLYSINRSYRLLETHLLSTVAISLTLLDWYFQLPRHAPHLGVQQVVKALCDPHNHLYQQYLCDQFTLAFDTFLAIQHEVESRVKVLLNRSQPHWRVKNSCPVCRYKLDDEPVLIIPGMFAYNGNFALKRSAAAGTADKRIFVSDYKIKDKSIDLYANGASATVDDVNIEELNKSG